MTKQAVVALNGICLGLGLNMQLFRQKFFIRFPVVGCYLSDLDILDGIPQMSSGFRATVAKYAVDEFFAISINSNPYPTVVFFKET